MYFISKCTCLRLNYKLENQKIAIYLNYMLLRNNSISKYLGVTMYRTLTFKQHFITPQPRSVQQIILCRNYTTPLGELQQTLYVALPWVSSTVLRNTLWWVTIRLIFLLCAFVQLRIFIILIFILHLSSIISFIFIFFSRFGIFLKNYKFLSGFLTLSIITIINCLSLKMIYVWTWLANSLISMLRREKLYYILSPFS